MPPKTQTLRLFPALLCLTVLTGCLKQGLPFHYYTLTSDAVASTALQRTDLPMILVPSVQVASFLDQGQLVRRTAPNGVTLAEQHCWAGSLGDMMGDVFILNLSRDLATENVYSFPSVSDPKSWQVELNVYHFEEDEGGMARMEFRWRLVSASEQRILYSDTASYRIKPTTSGYEGLVQALSQGVARLSREIASHILRLAPAGKGADHVQKLKNHVLLYGYLFSFLFLGTTARAFTIERWLGQTVYVPIYSHIYADSRFKDKPFQLTAILSIRNTDLHSALSVDQVDYYDSHGKLLKHYLAKPVTIGALASTRYIVPESDTLGGSGAKFIVTWSSKDAVTEPIIEGVMIGTKMQQGISFVTNSQILAGTKVD